MEIRKYTKADEEQLFSIIAEEGEAWRDYHSPAGREKYIQALSTSATYIAYEGNVACGYVRCREDNGIGIYVYDLLVRRSCRGRSIGKMLMENVGRDFPGQAVHVMSGVDPYYEKLGYHKEGSIYLVSEGKPD